MVGNASTQTACAHVSNGYGLEGIQSTRNIEFVVRNFTAHIRPVLEYASIVWSPPSVALNDLLNNVQQRFSKRQREMSLVRYDDRLIILNLSSLSQRRIYNDLLLAFKAVNNQTGPDADDVGRVLRDSNTRSQGMRLQHYDPQSALLANTYKCSTPIQWEKIPGHTATYHYIMSFKKELKQHLTVF